MPSSGPDATPPEATPPEALPPRGTGRGDLGVTLLVQTPGKLDDHQRSLLRQLAEARGEDGPEVAVEKQHKGVFGWLKDAFTQ